MVDIIVGIPPIQTNQDKGDRRPRAPNQKRLKERRKNKNDRRRSVRDGIVVTLSERVERRGRPDRRKSTAPL